MTLITQDLEMMSPMSEEAPSLKEAVEELTEEQKKTRSKANKILDKLKGTEGAELKKVLFSLKTFFQEDKNLVADFIQVSRENIAKLDNDFLAQSRLAAWPSSWSSARRTRFSCRTSSSAPSARSCSTWTACRGSCSTFKP